MTDDHATVGQNVGRGVLAGLAGTVVMTAFQKLVEMPVTGRQDSYAPAHFAQKVLPITAHSDEHLEALNWATHFALGAMWGSAYGLAAQAGLSGPKAVAAVFAVVYTSDLALNTALGLYAPASWSAEDWAVDMVDKLVQSAATGAVFEQIVGPRPDS